MSSPAPTLHPAGHLVGGKYRVESVLEQRGEVVVYAASDSGTGAPVSVKVLPGAAEATSARFLQEARAAGGLQHPSLVRVQGQGQEPDGTLFLVHERLKGTLLRDWMERRDRLPVRGAIEVAVPVMGGLVSAHSAGAIHGRLTPESVLLFDTGKDPLLPRVFDFGVSALGGTGAERYRSPEQLQGVPDLDGRTDVWSMAVVLYEMLAGAPPFQAATPEELAAQITAARPQRLAERCPDVPRDLSEVIHRALVADREIRPLNMRFFLEALLACASLPAQFGGTAPDVVFKEFLHYRGHGGNAPGAGQAEAKPEWEQKLERESQLERSRRDAGAPAAPATPANPAAGQSGGLPPGLWIVGVAALVMAAIILVLVLRR